MDTFRALLALAFALCYLLYRLISLCWTALTLPFHPRFWVANRDSAENSQAFEACFRPRP